jgi:outer membrane protein assembly factor BamB
MLQKDAQHTGFATGSAPNSPQLKFTVKYAERNDFALSPIILGNKVIVTGWGSNFSLYAMDKASGKLLWTSPVSSEAVATPAAYNDRIVVPSRNGYLYCFDADNGDLVWKFRIQWAGWAGMFIPPSPIIQDGIIYQTGGSSVYSIYSISLLEMENETTPKLVWKYDLTLDMPPNRTIVSSPTYGDGRIFLAYSLVTGENQNCTNNLICLDANDGRLLWNNTVASRHTKNMFDCPNPSFSNGYIYGEGYGTVYCFEVISGKLLWSIGSGQWGGGTSPAISLGKVYIVTTADGRNNSLLCLDASNGNIIWQHSGFMGDGGPVFEVTLSSPAVADGKVFTSSMMQSHEEFYALSAANGEFVWNYSAANGTPAISDGAVYVTEVVNPPSGGFINGSVTAFGVPEYFWLSISSLFGNVTGAGFYPVNSIAQISVDSPLSVGEGARYVFKGWTGDFVSDAKAASVVMNSSKTLSANWKLQYYLTVDSPYGSPKGEGWYDANSTAVFSVNPTDGFVVRSHFLHWVDDSTSSDATSSILMDSPKKVTAVWETDTSSLFLPGVATGVTLVVLVVAGVVILKRRKKKPSKSE